VQFSNNWIWQGEALLHQAGTGVAVSDPAALNGQAWVGRAGIDAAGAWYGPYTPDLEQGDGKYYRAIFRLKTDAVTQAGEIARLDVTNAGGTRLLGFRQLRGIDFRAPNTYQEIVVDFWNRPAWSGESTVNSLEFRIYYTGLANLYFDRVLVTCNPIPIAPFVTWGVPALPGNHQIQAKFADRAGNVSADQQLLVRLLGPTPTPTATASPTRTATPLPTPTPTATPVAGRATITFSINAVYADQNRNGTRDPGEPLLDQVRMQLVDRHGVDMLPPVTAGAWHFSVEVPALSHYYFTMSARDYSPRIVPVTAPDVGGVILIAPAALGMQPATVQAFFPLLMH
jgi:hypothetical protein